MTFDELRFKLDDEAKGIGLHEGFVPCTTLYACVGDGTVDDKIVGRLSIRHKLTDALQIYGGHIGYAVSPPHRGKGNGHEMLKQSMYNCRWRGIKELLLTVGKDNGPSIAIIKKCGGVFADEFWDAARYRTTQRWTIKI